jgi:hypothetical protein
MIFCSKPRSCLSPMVTTSTSGECLRQVRRKERRSDADSDSSLPLSVSVCLSSGRYSEIYECPPRRSHSLPRRCSSPLSEDGTQEDRSGPQEQRAIKLVRKADYVASVMSHEERACTLLREIVLLWRGHYKAVFDDEDGEGALSERPFMKIYGLMETRSRSPIHPTVP